MKIFFKQSFILIVSIASAIVIVFYTEKFAQPRFVQNETLKVKDIIARVFPGYNFSDEASVQLDTKKVRYWPGITDTDGMQKKLFVFMSVIPGYYYNLKLIAGIDEENRITGICLLINPGDLSSCADNRDAIGNTPDMWIVKERGVPDRGLSDPEFLAQFKRIDYKKAIRIEITGSGKRFPEGGTTALNLINTYRENISAVKIIAGDLKDFLNAVSVIMSTSQENAMEVK